MSSFFNGPRKFPSKVLPKFWFCPSSNCPDYRFVSEVKSLVYQVNTFKNHHPYQRVSDGIYNDLPTVGTILPPLVNLEVGVIKDWSVGNIQGAIDLTIKSINDLQGEGIYVESIVMDEPFHGAKVNEIDFDFAIDMILDYMEGVRGYYNELQIGIIEPYPALDSHDIRSLTDHLEIDFLHLDIDIDDVRRKKKNLKEDLLYIDPSGIVLWGYDKNNFSETYKKLFKELYYALEGNWPERLIVQSWADNGKPSVTELEGLMEWTKREIMK